MDPLVRGVATGKDRRAIRAAMDEAEAKAAGAPPPAPAPVPETYDATDGAAELMAEKRINPAAVTGSGAEGRIVKADVEAWLKERENG